MEKKKVLIIYHNEDNDGVLSASMMYEHYKTVVDLTDKESKDSYVHFFGANYEILSDLYNDVPRVEYDNKTFDEVFSNYDTICMVDLSFNIPEAMLKLRDMYGDNFVWIDHHAPVINSSISDGYSDIPGIRDTGRSTILLVYRYLYDPNDEQYNENLELCKIPRMYMYLSAYDSWTYEKYGLELDYVSAINTAITDMSSLKWYWWVGETENERNIDVINRDDIDFEKLYQQGLVLKEKKRMRDNDMIRRSGDLRWTVGGRRACMVVTSGPTNSMTFSAFKDKGDEIEPKDDISVVNGIVFKKTKTDNWVVSLYNIYNNSEFDCGKYLKENYGGGGHKGAAGATIPHELFVEILKNKKI